MVAILFPAFSNPIDRVWLVLACELIRRRAGKGRNWVGVMKIPVLWGCPGMVLAGKTRFEKQRGRPGRSGSLLCFFLCSLTPGVH